MKTYQVTQNLGWASPGMLIFVDDDGYIVGQQTNPSNSLTAEYADDGEHWGEFDPSEYASIKEYSYEYPF